MSRTRLVVLVRHADALGRSSWQGADDERPLTPKGERQALALVDALVAFAPSAALTSPARRCADTLAPLARAIGLTLEPALFLAEGSPPKAALGELLETASHLPAPPHRPASLVACSHGDVIDGVAATLIREGVPIEAHAHPGPLLTTPKGAFWQLEVDDGLVSSARLFGPPGKAR
jgi:phosphohistidine phosphatase SixA